FQLSLDILNFANLLSSDLGVRQVADPSAQAPLRLAGWTVDANREPVFNFTGPDKTFMDDPGEYSRWRIQIGLRYFF
ncbi:MAG: hypothetical protein JSW54_07800, partial [Fidelibacterota bacterium]